MKIATINLPDDYLSCIETMVNLGYMPSRSECVREALKQFLNKEGKLMEDLHPVNFEAIKKKQMSDIRGF